MTGEGNQTDVAIGRHRDTFNVKRIQVAAQATTPWLSCKRTTAMEFVLFLEFLALVVKALLIGS